MTPLPSEPVLGSVFTSLSEEILVPDNYLNPDCVPHLGCMGLTQDFPFELLQKLLSFESTMGFIMKEDDTNNMPGWFLWMASR
ncbi:hypothetical protein AVEN_188207-1 [Araneus ventricosus]|uniref:Uncharacterized protein n=1 Tax=Araneus ventricosus TaxID=182803 RepID=A0A4Y2HY63_ARAVE|nr:hypothetical protein AVEN_188207-1 [Araneus ventricosus]